MRNKEKGKVSRQQQSSGILFPKGRVGTTVFFQPKVSPKKVTEHGNIAAFNKLTSSVMNIF